ncbi:DNA primase small subunit [Erpetoichthys calabaricus]|uniref:DNA primase small subunit n=1 Tax=Erpetoichthys calabaricus TaxID=27687 RepID=UPI00223474CF|nr:DNA primase small subunit [Erpetoichthys calabaricus]
MHCGSTPKTIDCKSQHAPSQRPVSSCLVCYRERTTNPTIRHPSRFRYSRALGLVSMSDVYDPASLPDLLPLYYRRLFPFSQYFRWLNYGGVTKNYFQNREFSFTLKDDIYVRYQCFSNQSELEKEMQKMCPYKIDIGAVYSHRPNQHNAVKSGSFQAQEKELVFDIDMTDYDDVRSCCSSADICHKCWTLMKIAVRVLDRALKEDFGFEHRLWVYSGRRGVHCWVCDEAARKLSQSARSAVAEYLSLIRGGSETIKKVQLSTPVHPFITESLSLIMSYFEDYALIDQDILGRPESVENVLALLPEDILLETCSDFQKYKTSVKRWESLKKRVKQGSQKNSALLDSEIVLQYCYPRLDVNVSKGVNHLLKSPFSVHPKTGRISVPIDTRQLDQFDPFAVPTISMLCQELDKAVQSGEEDESGKDKEGEPEPKRRVRDYKRTSLGKYVKVFELFVEQMEKSWKGQLLKQSDMQGDF